MRQYKTGSGLHQHEHIGQPGPAIAFGDRRLQQKEIHFEVISRLRKAAIFGDLLRIEFDIKGVTRRSRRFPKLVRPICWGAAAPRHANQTRINAASRPKQGRICADARRDLY